VYFSCALATGKYLHADNILLYGEKIFQNFGRNIWRVHWRFW